MHKNLHFLLEDQFFPGELPDPILPYHIISYVKFIVLPLGYNIKTMGALHSS